MINFWISLPLELRLALLSIIGMVLAAASNHAIYRYCWFPRPIDPWGKPDAQAAPRKPTDRVPILGWFALRRESPVHGRGFWIRPMLIEVAMAIGIPALYWFETQTGALLPIGMRIPASIQAFEPWATTIFASHLVLVTLMVVATFIDFDEQTIPDLVTVPGTLMALTFAAVSVFVFLPATTSTGSRPVTFELPFLLAPKWFGPQGWWTGAGIWTLWCFALADRRLILRRGLAKAIEFFFAGLVRHRTWMLLLGMWVAGLVSIRVVFGIGGQPWLGLLSSLIGLGIGGGVVWAIRIVASAAMRVEALGFGDVTLMCMIGAFLGWQGAILGFFLAPIAAVLIVLVYFIITRESRVPFGPYLCLGTLLTILMWDPLFNGWFLTSLAILGPVLLWLFVALTGMTGAILFIWRLIKERFITG
ncbi:prepilin peptidase [Roseiconus nitratireducens]|uniref:Prepilin peptidase n=1 Tax=Roseiconus nitratireducens TaxID=2605748 RepID=A0A5M6DFB4_9BACT|nr:prepilin peptidase [Roseiconus nitratireducens]KAA5546178.1 prepilin peptidase [Roseiconus nitratireducens]